jgi:uncharacterized membrane protein YfcA
MAYPSVMAISAIFAISSLVQAVTGFGFSLLAVPLLTMVVGPVDAVVGSSVVVLPLNAVNLFRDRAEVAWRTVTRILVTGCAGLPLGLIIICFVSPRVLSGTIAVIVLGAAVTIWRGIRFQPSWISATIAGLATGVLTTATGINGPPLAAAFSAMDLHPRQFRSTLAAIFVTMGFAGIVGYVVTAQVSNSSVRLALVGAPAVAVGWTLGDLAFSKAVDAGIFRKVVLCSLAAVSCVVLIKICFFS